MKMGTQYTKTYDIQQKREVYSHKCLHQKRRKISNNLTLHLKELEEQEYTKSKISRWKKNSNDQNKNKRNKD